MLLKDKHLYLVEDDPTNFAIIRTILRAQGANTMLDHWGDTSLQNLLNYPFNIDLFILDLMLPGNVSGYDVYDALTKHEKFKDVPAVIVSAADPDSEIPKAKERGIHGFISKPINRHHFPNQILSLIKGEEIWE